MQSILVIFIRSLPLHDCTAKDSRERMKRGLVGTPQAEPVLPFVSGWSSVCSAIFTDSEPVLSSYQQSW
jgi:hypothetical protein